MKNQTNLKSKKHSTAIINFSIIFFIILLFLFWLVVFPTTFDPVQNITDDFNEENTQTVLEVFDLQFNYDENIENGYLLNATDFCYNYYVYDVSENFKEQITHRYSLDKNKDHEFYNHIDNTLFSGQTYRYYDEQEDVEMICIFKTIDNIDVACLKYRDFSEQLETTLKQQ